MRDREKEQVAEETRNPAIGIEPRRSCFIIMLAAREVASSL